MSPRKLTVACAAVFATAGASAAETGAPAASTAARRARVWPAPRPRGLDGKPVAPPDVTDEAFQQALRIAFDRADTDRSGALSTREWATTLQ